MVSREITSNTDSPMEQLLHLRSCCVGAGGEEARLHDLSDLAVAHEVVAYQLLLLCAGLEDDHGRAPSAECRDSPWREGVPRASG